MARASLMHAAFDKIADLTARGLIGRKLYLADRATCVRLDDFTWSLLRDIADREGITRHKLCAAIDNAKPPGLPLSTALRLAVLSYYRDAATERGHSLAGHGKLVEH